MWLCAADMKDKLGLLFLACCVRFPSVAGSSLDSCLIDNSTHSWRWQHSKRLGVCQSRWPLSPFETKKTRTKPTPSLSLWQVFLLAAEEKASRVSHQWSVLISNQRDGGDHFVVNLGLKLWFLHYWVFSRCITSWSNCSFHPSRSLTLEKYII